VFGFSLPLKFSGDYVLSKKQLLSPPSDITRLERLENHLVECAHRYIDETVTKAFDVKSVKFECLLNNSFAFSRVDSPNGEYVIQFGRALTSAILKFSESISSRLSAKINWEIEDDITEFAFNYISWFILNHELAHITFGHLNFTQEHGENGYYEVNENKRPIKHLSKNLQTSKEFWQALESEADGNAISTALVSFKHINTANQWGRWKLDKVLEVHGIVNSLMFYFLDVLMEGTDDFRHPKPYIRQYLSLPSIDALAVQMKHPKQFYTDSLIKANFDTVINILEIKPPVFFMIESINWMNRLDQIIREMGINSYRRRKKI